MEKLQKFSTGDPRMVRESMLVLETPSISLSDEVRVEQRHFFFGQCARLKLKKVVLSA